MSIVWWMEKRNVVYPHNRILFNNKKEWSTNTCRNMDETWKHYVEWKKPVTKDFMLYDATYMKCPE